MLLYQKMNLSTSCNNTAFTFSIEEKTL